MMMGKIKRLFGGIRCLVMRIGCNVKVKMYHFIDIKCCGMQKVTLTNVSEDVSEEKVILKIWWFQKCFVPLHPIMMIYEKTDCSVLNDRFAYLYANNFLPTRCYARHHCRC